jgi:hypothetical protein
VRAPVYETDEGGPLVSVARMMDQQSSEETAKRSSSELWRGKEEFSAQRRGWRETVAAKSTVLTGWTGGYNVALRWMCLWECAEFWRER